MKNLDKKRELDIIQPPLVRRLAPLYLPLIFLSSVGCPFFDASVNNTGFGDSSGDVTHQERDVSGELALALGGVADGTDEIVLDDSFRSLDFENEDPDLFSLSFRDGFLNYLEGTGAKVIPLSVGIGYVTPIEDGRSLDPVQVTIPPQKLIQILIGEARGELEREATLSEDEEVKLSSVSVTGDAVGAVIRNRINLIEEHNNPSLFEADPDLYNQNPPLSRYEAVIEANDGVLYQFSPVDPEDPSYDDYLLAANRGDFLNESLNIAYDQAVLTAANIFNENTEDPTGNSFAFYSPTSSQYQALEEALQNGTRELPLSAGVSDASFPSLTPLQVLILDEIASSADDDDTPSFVFVRSRSNSEPAVTDEP